MKIILGSKENKSTPRWGTCSEKIREVERKLYSKEIKKNVEKKIELILKKSRMTREVESKLYNKEIKNNIEKKIESILKESGMRKEKFNEITGIALEMKSSGQTNVLVATLISIA